ncbi:Serine dehydrogenase proteinase [Anatilimnocola aggregata]|uniref:Serine dehydrogenase proteinase n=1 Tax=Anatilimnocola aggregata TaxID=2528021 RepID=A0A517YN25_9BACT|nr:NfeD family protein [Anatilimnocola aggregata]QDU31611.1 Serine dehydrogenase proteinase [Anatilimnocola aggregata]
MRRRHSVPQSRLRQFSLGALLLAIFASLLLAQEAAPEVIGPQSKFQKAAVIQFNGSIDGWTKAYVERKLAAARQAGADLIVFEIDSPGGYLQESLDIANKLNSLSGVHTVAFIPREALSGAALVSLGCDEIIMRPTARLGDVGVIFLDQDFMFRHAPEKIRSPLVTEMRVLAAEHKRPPALAEAMVDMDSEVFHYVNERTNAEEYLTEKEASSKADSADWEKRELVLESKKGSFLTVSGERAKALTLAEGTVANLDELKARYNVAGKWKTYDIDNIDRAVYILTLWWVTGLLFVLGLVGVLYECCAPGTCIGGLLALTCASLFFWSRFLSGTSGWLEVILFGLGLVFLAIELFVLPGFGVSGVAGLLLLGVSVVLASQRFIIPETAADLTITIGSIATLMAAGFIFAGIAYAMTSYLGRIPLLSQLILTPGGAMADATESIDATDTVVPAAKKVAVGAIGRTTTILRPSGRAIIDGERVDVVSTGDVIGVNVDVRVVEIGYGRIVVEEYVG